MKQIGRQIVGDYVKVDDLTKDWKEVTLNPSIFYRRYDEFMTVFDKFEGLYTTMDTGQRILVRMNHDKDLEDFMEKFCDYI